LNFNLLLTDFPAIHVFTDAAGGAIRHLLVQTSIRTKTQRRRRSRNKW